MGKQWKQWETLFSWVPKSLQMVTVAMKLKDACSLEEQLWQTQTCMKKQRHHFPDKGRIVKATVFPVVMYGCERWTIKKAAAAAKSLQSCPTLCDPIDGSPPGSPIPGILQERTLEWVAISFSSAWKWKVKVKSLSHVWLFTTTWTAAYQAPPPVGFSRQEYWSGLPLPSPKKAEHQRINAFKRGAGEDSRVLWRSNQSILKAINPEYSLEGLILKLKLQYLGHLMWRADSLEKTLMLGKTEDQSKEERAAEDEKVR